MTLEAIGFQNSNLGERRRNIMPKTMSRGKNQIMYNYLPGYTFDFDKSSAIGLIEHIRGDVHTDLNLEMVLQAIKHQAAAWGDLAPMFSEPRHEQFALLEPRRVYARLFPKVFWCQNRQCGQVFDFTHSDSIPKEAICQKCKHGRLAQLRWVKIHQCGDIKPLTPPYECSKCKSRNQFSLDTRGSERISQFVWVCRKCGAHSSLFAGNCTSCNWEALSGDNDKQKQQMSIEVHRARRVFYSMDIVLLNQPGSDINKFLTIEKWQLVIAGFFLELPELVGKTVKKYASDQQLTSTSALTISETEIAQLRTFGKTDQEVEQFQQMQAQLSDFRLRQDTTLSPKSIGSSITEKTGVTEGTWFNSGHELLEAVLPFQSNQTQNLFSLPIPNTSQIQAKSLAAQLGAYQLSLASDFPMTHVTFGYSRAEYAPRQSRLNPFPPDRDHQGKFPLFVDLIQADAIIVQIDPQRVWRWLEINGWNAQIPQNATDVNRAQRAYFVNLFSNLYLQPVPITLTQTLTADYPEARLVFGLIHTMSHLFLKKAALLCGLDHTSLSEYVLPRALMFAIYSNHRFGATIGALTSLFEQSLPDWLGLIANDSRRCIYDPVCQSTGGNCHACTQLAETSCRFFNVNLGRPFLFGGMDKELGEIKFGYLDVVLNKQLM
jgi:ribosomal protein L40E